MQASRYRKKQNKIKTATEEERTRDPGRVDNQQTATALLSKNLLYFLLFLQFGNWNLSCMQVVCYLETPEDSIFLAPII